MARKKATTPSTVRGRGRGRGRSRSPGRATQGNNQEPATETFPGIREFWYRPQEEYYEEHINNSIIQGTAYNFNDFEFGFERVKQVFAYQGWIEFCSMDAPMDHILIRKWYANLIPSETHTCFHTLVGGNEVRWTPQVVRGHLNEISEHTVINGEGVRFEHNIHDSTLIPNFDKVTKFDDLFQEEFKGKNSKNASHLTPEHRLMFHIICHCIIPTGGSYTSMSHTSMCILYCLSKEIKMNLTYSIINHMCSIRKNPKCAYAYGMLITSYAHANYNLIVEAPMVNDVNKFGYSRLKKLFTKNEDDTWCNASSNSSKRSRTESGSEMNIIPISSSEPSWTMPSSSSHAPSYDHYAQQVPPYDSPNDHFPHHTNAGPSNAYAPQAPIYENVRPMAQQSSFYGDPYAPHYGMPGAPPHYSAYGNAQAPPSYYDHQATVNATLIGQLHHLQLITRRIEGRIEDGFHTMENQYHNLGQTMHTMGNTQRLMGRQMVTLNQRVQRLDDHFSTQHGLPPPPSYNNGRDGFDRASYEEYGLPFPGDD